jgi:hypothetical protein
LWFYDKMLKQLIFIFFLFQFIHLQQVKFVQVITRHGDRTPIFTPLPTDKTVWNCTLDEFESTFTTNPSYPTHLQTPYRIYTKIYKPNSGELLGNCSKGQLSGIGRQQLFQVGQKFRNYYIKYLKFLSDGYKEDEIYVESSDVPRTIQSAQYLMLGLYPIAKNERIIIHTSDEEQSDYEFSFKCPKLYVYIAGVVKKLEFLKFQAIHLPAKLALDAKMKKMIGFEVYYDHFRCYKARGLPLPEGVTEDHVRHITEYINGMFQFFFREPKIVRLAIGRLMKRLYMRMSAVVEGKPSHKFVLYSGHDTTVGPVLAALGFYNYPIPPYASNLVIELLQKETSFFVKVIYNGEILLVPGCKDKLCD